MIIFVSQVKKLNHMKTILLSMIFMSTIVFGQVGINTTNPRTTLDIRKSSNLNFPDGIILPKISADSLRLKDSFYGSDQEGTMIWVTKPITANLSTAKTQFIHKKGYYIYDSEYVHPDNSKGIWKSLTDETPLSNNAFAASGSTGISLISLGINLLGSEFRTINLSSPNLTISIGNNLISNNQYTVPESGIYMISYQFRFGQGITAELLSAQRPGLAIAKTSGSTNSVLDYSIFGGVQLINLGALGLVNVSLSQGQINHLFQLQAGDKLNFGVITGGLNLSLLGDTSTEISIHKIS